MIRRYSIPLIVLFVLSPTILSGCRMRAVLPGEAPPIPMDRIPIVYGFGREHRVEIAVTEPEWSAVRAEFEPPAAHPSAEREQIRRAVATLERVTGTKTPTGNDVARNAGHGYGQMDCIDETTNTTTYLRMMQEQDLLAWHVVTRPVYRGPLGIMAHNSAAIEDRNTGRQFVVDSWFRDNGELPFVQPLDDWHRFRPFDDE